MIYFIFIIILHLHKKWIRKRWTESIWNIWTFMDINGLLSWFLSKSHISLAQNVEKMKKFLVKYYAKKT